MSIKTHAIINPSRPRAVGECDRCGFVFLRHQLAPQMRYAGSSVIDTGWRVCSACMDPLDPQEKTTITLPDGLPIPDPRPVKDPED